MTPEKLTQLMPTHFRVPVYTYLTVPLAVLAAPLEMAFPACHGQIGFVLMLLPIVMSAFDGGFRSATITSVAGAIGLISAACFAYAASNDSGPLFVAMSLPIAWAIALVGCGIWLGRCLEIVRRRADKLQDQCDQHERSIYQLYKDSSEIAADHERERQRRLQEESQRVDFSRLLLNIQHLGRELCSNLQMSAVFQLVTDAAKKLLKSGNPRIYLLDEQTRELVDYTSGTPTERIPADRGMLGWAVQHGQIITQEDVATHHALADLTPQDRVAWQACAPLLFGERVLGVLGIDSITQRNQEFDRLLYIVANFCAVAVNNGRMFERAQEMAQRDGLTGLLNHATFQKKLAEAVEESRPSGRGPALIISDVDHFKQFNDRYGHQAGDFVLKSVAETWMQLVPAHAIVARYGGEEFVCLLPDTTLDEAAECAESLRFALETSKLEFAQNSLCVTASFGVASFPASADSASALIRVADAAMYSAKRSGRNRVCVAPPAPVDSGTTPELAKASV